ncbi:MAG: carboxypeptidase-like regulatory domain-containing protein [Candidatus Marinimicrobia bacterium]|nr:carboxypeptidase-like regulatory domain-containing protein [Candidatus Neomarinimicrobiota bacterium]
MDCKTIQQNDIHEKYLLGKLENSVKDKYLTHLQECHKCQQELDDLKILIEGIQTAGEIEMKQEIQRYATVGEFQKRQHRKWILLKVAAVLIFVILTPTMIYRYQLSKPPINSDAVTHIKISPFEIPKAAEILPETLVRVEVDEAVPKQLNSKPSFVILSEQSDNDENATPILAMEDDMADISQYSENDFASMEQLEFRELKPSYTLQSGVVKKETRITQDGNTKTIESGLKLREQKNTATKGFIQGMITDTNGNPLPGAQVYFRSLQMGANADMNGRYKIFEVPEGIFNISVMMIGYETQLVNDITVTNDTTISLDFALDTSEFQGEVVAVMAAKPKVETSETLFTRKHAKGQTSSAATYNKEPIISLLSPGEKMYTLSKNKKLSLNDPINLQENLHFFMNNGDTVMIQIIPPDEELEIDQESGLPFEFDVIRLSGKDQKLNMEWYVNPEILSISTGDIKIKVKMKKDRKKLMTVYLNGKEVYQINLKRKKTTAILIGK